MPVDMSIPNSIIGAYLQGLRLRQEREQNQQRLVMNIEELKARREMFAEGLKVKKEELDIKEQLAQSSADARKARNHLEFQQSLFLGKEPLLEDPENPGAFYGLNPITQEKQYVPNDLARRIRQMNIRSEGEATSDVAAMTTEKKAAALEPFTHRLLAVKEEIANKAREQAQTYKLEAIEEQAKNEQTMQALKTNDAKTLLELKRQGQLDIERIRGSYRLQAANISKKGDEFDLSPELIKQAAEQAATGVINTTDLPKIVGGIKNVPKVYAEMNKMKLAPLNKSQVDNLEALKMVNRVDKIFSEMNDIIQTKGRAAFFDTRYSALKDELKQVAPLVRGLVKNAGAFSNQDADRAEGGAPSLSDGPANTFSKKASQHKAESFHQLVRDRRKSIVGKLSLRHQKMIQNAYELSPDPDLEEAQ